MENQPLGVSPQPPVPPPSAALSAPTKPKTFLLVALGLVLMLGLLLAGVVLGQKGFLSGILSFGKPSPTPTLALTPTPDPTANWQVYLNRENGYQIKYPEDIFVRIICPGEELILEKRKEGEERKIVEMPTCNRDSPYTVEGRTNASNYRVSEPKSDEYYQVTKETVSIGGIEMQKYTKRLVTKPNYPYVEWQQQVWIPHGDKKHYLTFSNKELLKYYDQILSTFKFLGEGMKVTPEPTMASLRIPQKRVDTSSWVSKSYPKMFVSFKIPSSWEEKSEGEFNFDNLVRRAMFDDPNWGLSFDFSVSLYNNPKRWGRREFWWREVAGSKESSYSEHGAKYVKDVTEWNMDGENALSLYFTEYSGGGTYFMVPRGDQTIVLFFNGELAQNNKFETIVSTFEFLE
jgi:hypothetical protein